MTSNSSTAASSTSTTSTSTSAASSSKPKISVGSKAVICDGADIRGEVTIGAGSVLHPKCTLFAHAGPIILGEDCIVEENVVLVNRLKQPMLIGSHNLFEVGCRIESPSIGDYNTFEPRCRVPATVSISDYCVIGAACSVAPDTPATASDFADLEKLVSSTPSHAQEDAQEPPQESTEQTQLQTQVDSLPSYTVVYGSENKRRIWSGEGKEQQKALFVKHLIYLRETLVKHHKLKLIT